MQAAPAESREDPPGGEGADVTGEIDLATSTITERVDNILDGALAMLPNLGIALVVLVVGLLLGSLVRRIVNRTARAHERDDLGSVLGGFARAATILFFAAIALTILAPSLSIGSLVSSLGIGSVAIGFAFKDILQNWLAGLLILIRQPFHIGDQIEVKTFEGTVEHIETRATLIRTYDGQRVVIPNSDVYTNAVVVRTAHDIRRSQYDVGVGYSTDLEEACRIARDVMGRVEGVLADPEPEALPWDLAASGVTIRLRWWTQSTRSHIVHSTSAVVRGIKLAYDEANIDIPYETNVVLFHDQTDERDGSPGRQFEGWPAPPDGSKVRPARTVSQGSGGGTAEDARTTF